MVQSGTYGPPRDLAYEYDLLHRMEGVLVDGIPLSEYPLFERYSYWNRFVQFVFSADIKRFSAERAFDGYLKVEGGRNVQVSLKGFLVSLAGVAITMCAWWLACVLRPQVTVFGIDRVSDARHKADFRIQALHIFLRKYKVSYMECFHTVFNASFLKNLFSRMRFAFYLESLDVRYALMRRLGMVAKRHDPELSGLEKFNQEERAFVSYVIKKYIGEKALIEFRVKELTRFLKDSHTKAVWMIDDARHYHDISLAAKFVGIPSYAFQHGHFTQYHVGWLKEPKTKLQYIRPDYLVLWSEYWKKELMRLEGVFPEETLIVGGYSEEADSLPADKASTLSILIPHETDSPKAEVILHIQKILESQKDVEVVFKFRPDYSQTAQEAEYGSLMKHPNVRVIKELTELTHRPSVVVGVYSSFLYDMVRARVPVALMETSMDYGQGMITNGLATPLPLKGDTLAILTALRDTPDTVLENRFHALQSEEGLTETLASIARSCGVLRSKTVG